MFHIVQLLCSEKVQEKLKQELDKYAIKIGVNESLLLVERGFPIPDDRMCIVFDGIDYMEAVRLLASGISREHSLTNAITGFSRNRFKVIDPRQILYLEAGADGIMACTPEDHYMVRETLQYYELNWSDKGFVRINKSQIVNLLRVREIIPWFNSRYVLRLENNRELEVSKVYARVLRSTLKM